MKRPAELPRDRRASRSRIVVVSANGLALASPLAPERWRGKLDDVPSPSVSLFVQLLVMRPSVAWRSVRELPSTNGIPKLEGMRIVENLLG